jgi:hypothetical protein
LALAGALATGAAVALLLAALCAVADAVVDAAVGALALPVVEDPDAAVVVADEPRDVADELPALLAPHAAKSPTAAVEDTNRSTCRRLRTRVRRVSTML